MRIVARRLAVALATVRSATAQGATPREPPANAAWRAYLAAPRVTPSWATILRHLCSRRRRCLKRGADACTWRDGEANPRSFLSSDSSVPFLNRSCRGFEAPPSLLSGTGRVGTFDGIGHKSLTIFKRIVAKGVPPPTRHVFAEDINLSALYVRRADVDIPRAGCGAAAGCHAAVAAPPRLRRG